MLCPNPAGKPLHQLVCLCRSDLPGSSERAREGSHGEVPAHPVHTHTPLYPFPLPLYPTRGRAHSSDQRGENRNTPVMVSDTHIRLVRGILTLSSCQLSESNMCFWFSVISAIMEYYKHQSNMCTFVKVRSCSYATINEIVKETQGSNEENRTRGQMVSEIMCFSVKRCLRSISADLSECGCIM